MGYPNITRAQEKADREGLVTTMRESEVVDLLMDHMIPKLTTEQRRLKVIDDWYHWTQDDPPLPRNASVEHKRLLQLSKTPWLNLVVSTVGQAMVVSGYRTTGDSNPDAVWRIWNANRMNGAQSRIHRATLEFGYSYTVVKPGVSPLYGPMPVITGVSPEHMLAVYNDPINDEWPLYALQVSGSGERAVYHLYDESLEHIVRRENGRLVYSHTLEHNVGVVPVVRYINQMDLDGQIIGEVEPFIGVASRINKTAYDRLLTQHYNSWKVRTVAGLGDFAQDQGEANEKKMQLRQDDILVAEDHDTKFGTLDETPLDGFIGAERADIETLAAVSQTPSHSLTGQMVNLSAEALAAARAPLTQKIAERQNTIGEGHNQTLRLASHIAGDSESAQDMSGGVTWQDMEVRSMSQAVDALGKASQMLGIPPSGLWSRIPGVTSTDVEEWTAKYEELDPLRSLSVTLDQADDGFTSN